MIYKILRINPYLGDKNNVEREQLNQVIPLVPYIMAEVGLSKIASVKFSIASSNLPALHSQMMSNYCYGFKQYHQKE